MNSLTFQRASELLRYDSLTGVFTWRVARRRVQPGDTAGTTNTSGHRSIAIDGRRYYAHRLAWLMATGEWPSAQIDHINGNPADNRFINLRDVCQSTNMQNLRKATAQNKSSGLLGTAFSQRAKKWQAKIRVDGKQRHLGFFTSAQEAANAYLKAKRKHHAGCSI